MEEISSNFIHDIIDADLSENPDIKIITRFPPEPTEYLHIGSAKAIWINYMTAKKDSYPCARSSDMSWTWPKNAHAYPLPQAPPAAQLCPEAEAYSICIQVADNPPLHHSQSGQPSCAHALRYQYGQHQPLPLVCEAEWT